MCQASKKKKKKKFEGSAETQATLTTPSGTIARAAGASSLFTKIAFFNGSITATLANARSVFLIHLIVISIVVLMYRIDILVSFLVFFLILFGFGIGIDNCRDRG